MTSRPLEQTETCTHHLALSFGPSSGCHTVLRGGFAGLLTLHLRTWGQRNGWPSESPQPAPWCLPSLGSTAVSACGLAECVCLDRHGHLVTDCPHALVGLIAFLRHE